MFRVWRNIHSQFEERSGSNLFSIQNLIGFNGIKKRGFKKNFKNIKKVVFKDQL